MEKVLEGNSLPHSPPSGEVKISWAIAQGVTWAGIPFEVCPGRLIPYYVALAMMQASPWEASEGII